jgi:hypothetical protein
LSSFFIVLVNLSVIFIFFVSPFALFIIEWAAKILLTHGALWEGSMRATNSGETALTSSFNSYFSSTPLAFASLEALQIERGTLLPSELFETKWLHLNIINGTEVKQIIEN